MSVDRSNAVAAPKSDLVFPHVKAGMTVIIAIMVMAAFANVANPGGCSYSKSQSAEATTEEVKGTSNKKAEVEA